MAEAYPRRNRKLFQKPIIWKRVNKMHVCVFGFYYISLWVTFILSAWIPKTWLSKNMLMRWEEWGGCESTSL